MASSAESLEAASTGGQKNSKRATMISCFILFIGFSAAKWFLCHFCWYVPSSLMFSCGHDAFAACICEAQTIAEVLYGYFCKYI